MEKVLEKKQPDIEVEECGSLPLKEWGIIKNELGIPLRREAQGYVLYEADDVPFLVGVSAMFSKPYNGSDYDHISRGALREVFTPFDD